ncbi:hypothetical protein GDO86_012599 [Hymenochirus boettgeri]|uniref:IGFBP N-terminal domain-containing protein n=1 Tax=Hymenochirus boettgeri TaxID=247094 RepID=A0A8T2IMY9_9PIPI|nr:hypothetical protein GDO86_012599 [Hymenochirus boettgeri]
MRFKCILLTFLFFMIQSSRANICSPCNETTCPPILFGCGSYRAIDPCGCCEHCARGNMEPCGGKNWEIGYCNRDLQCMAITGKGLVQIPMIGICKEIQGPGKEYFQDADENCPVQNVCYKVTGICDCFKKRTCIMDFFQYSEAYCNPALDYPPPEGEDELPEKFCFHGGCDIIEEKCVCESKLCDYTRKFQFSDITECNKARVKQYCANVTCPEVKPIPCPSDSELTSPYTPQGDCCPKVPSFCTCDFQRCNKSCPNGRRKIIIRESEAVPGRCCDKFLCLL